MSGRRRGGTTGGGDMTEAKARKAAEARGWRLKKRGKAFRLVDENGAVIAGDWTQPRTTTGSPSPISPPVLERSPPRKLLGAGRSAPHLAPGSTRPGWPIRDPVLYATPLAPLTI
jgi:hypothetical protein